MASSARFEQPTPMLQRLTRQIDKFTRLISILESQHLTEFGHEGSVLLRYRRSEPAEFNDYYGTLLDRNGFSVDFVQVVGIGRKDRCRNGTVGEWHS